MSSKYTEKHGRALLEVGNSWSSIFVTAKLEDDVHAIPRPVKHVGEHKYIMRIWNKMKKNKSYLENPRTIKDAIDAWAKEQGVSNEK